MQRGIMKAKVLPLPVLATEIKSCPFRDIGMANGKVRTHFVKAAYSNFESGLGLRSPAASRYFSRNPGEDYSRNYPRAKVFL